MKGLWSLDGDRSVGDGSVRDGSIRDASIPEAILHGDVRTSIADIPPSEAPTNTGGRSNWSTTAIQSAPNAVNE